MINSQIILWTLIFLAFYRGITYLVKLFYSFAWIGKYKKVRAKQNDKKLIIIIPLLREQSVVQKCFKNFTKLASDQVKLVFVTTAKEKYEYETIIFDKLLKRKKQILKAQREGQFYELTSGIFPQMQVKALYKKIKNLKSAKKKWDIVLQEYKKIPETKDILQQLIDGFQEKEKFSIVHYPYKKGVKTQQLNYACKILNRELQGKDKYFFAFYDADSFVSSKTMLVFNLLLMVNPNAKAIQQSALFFANYNAMGKSWRGKFLQDIAYLQSRWTLVHEVPRIVFQTKKKLGELESAHLIGHGLFIRADFLEKINYFPAQFSNEDIVLGYIIRLEGEKIYPLPVLENSSSPISIASMFSQYRTWFYGVFSYPSYVLYALKNKRYSRVKAIVWGGKYFVRSLIWLFTSFFWILLFLLSLIFIRDSSILILLAMLAFAIYAPLSFLILDLFLKKNSSIIDSARKVNPKLSYGNILLTIPVYLTHSFGPFLAIIDYIGYFFFKKEIVKRKTER